MNQYDRYKAYQAAYRDAHREQRRAHDRARRQRLRELPSDAPEKRAAAVYARQWQRRNRERLAESRRLAYRADPLKHNERWARREAAKRATAVEPIDYTAILRAAKGACGICQKPLDLFGIEFDHIVPLARGGTHTAGNIQATHASCNRSKGARVA